jgi:hypothetical protein
VRLDGEWIVVPDNAVVTEPNKFGLPLSGHTWAPTGKRNASFLAQVGKGLAAIRTSRLRVRAIIPSCDLIDLLRSGYIEVRAPVRHRFWSS